MGLARAGFWLAAALITTGCMILSLAVGLIVAGVLTAAMVFLEVREV